jgi:hypothetical protein
MPCSHRLFSISSMLFNKQTEDSGNTVHRQYYDISNLSEKKIAKKAGK